VEEVQRTLSDIGQQLQTKVKTPVSQGYRPELDASPELSPRQANYFQVPYRGSSMDDKAWKD
jgi:hypothetical protein